MSRNQCECEQEIMQALRTGVWGAELRSHVSACATCEETRRVAGSLLQYASELRVESTVEGADAIWRRAQAERQTMILKRAMRPLLFMRRLSAGCVMAFALWLLYGFSRAGYYPDYRDWLHASWGAGVGTAAVGIGVAMGCIGLGAFYMLREDRRRGVWSGVS